MLRFASAPRWFYGYEIAFDALSAIIVVLIALYGLKLYRFSGEKRHKYFSISFFLIAAAFLFKSLSNLVGPTEGIVGQIVWPITISEITSQSPAFMATYLGYRLFTLLGLIGIYSIIYKTAGRQIWVPLYLALVVTLFSTATYLLFYVTAFIFLFLIAFYYYENCRKLKTPQSKMLFAAFALIMVGQLLFLGISYKFYAYVIGELLQVSGYLLLLLSYIGLVVKNEANKT